MKKLLFLIIFISSNLVAQELKYSDLKSDTRPKGQFKSYLSKDSVVYKVGDKLEIGFPSYLLSKIETTSLRDRPGDHRKNTINMRFKWILYNGNGLDGIYGARPIAQNTQIEIKSIGVGGIKSQGFMVVLNCDDFYNKYIAILEDAVACGEIRLYEPTSEEAYSELKKNKDKLDLGLITQEKYDSIKKVLVKYIK